MAIRKPRKRHDIRLKHADIHEHVLTTKKPKARKA